MVPTPHADEGDRRDRPEVPPEVLEAIEDVDRRRTADGDDLDDALDL